MGTLMKNGIPYGGGGGGDNSKTVTYEQYKNLSEAEKNSDTTFYVPDYPGDLGRLSTAMSWKTIGSATGANPVVADFTKYDELLILVRVNAETTSNSVTIHILKDQLLPDKTNFFSGGSYVNTSSNVGTVIYGTTTQLQIGAAQNNGTDYKSSCEMIIYGLVYSSATSGGSVEIVDNLESTDTDKALSANMGRELKEDKVSKSEFNNVMPVTSDFGTVSGGYVKIGKVVTVNINIRLTSNLTSNSSNVVSGLPNTAVSYAQLPCLNVSSSVGLTAYILYGHVRILASNATHISSGQTITISGSYIAA